MDLPKFSATGAKYQFDASGFVAETVPDHTTVTTDQIFCKTWEIQNIGHVTWQNRKLRCVDQSAESPNILAGIVPPDSERRLRPLQTCIEIPETLPGDSVLLSVQFKAPSYPCSIISYWKMTDERGDICFPETEGLSCLVRVVSI
nr:NBR1-Ig-like domain-containing protein [Methylomonas sp. SURF-2]